MNEYEFELMVNGVACGTFTKEGKTETEAYEKAQEEIDGVMAQLPPTVNVEYSIGVA